MKKIETFNKHAEELRYRFFVCLIALLIAVAFFACFHKTLFEVWLRPTNTILEAGASQFIFTSPYDGIYVTVYLVFYAAMLFCVPVFLWHTYWFLKPALYENELRLVQRLLLGGGLMFGASVAASYYVLLPVFLRWLVQFNLDIGQTYWSVKEYLGFFISCIVTLSVGVCFVCVSFAAIIWLPRFRHIVRQYHAYVVVGIFFMSAVISPPDVFSQLILAIPVTIIFELLIHILP